MGLRVGRRGAAIGVAAGLLALGGSGVALLGDEPVRLAGAERLADPDGRGTGFLDTGRRAEGRSVDEARMASASDLAAGDGRLYVLFDGIPHADEGVLEIGPDGQVRFAGFSRVATGSTGPELTAVGVGAEGEVAAALGRDVLVHGFDWRDSAEVGRLHQVEVPFEVGAVGVVGRDEVLLGSAERGEIVVATPEGVETLVEGDFGAVRAIAPLGDGTVAFVAGDDRLHVVEDGEVRAVDTGEVNPVAAEDVDTEGLPRRDRVPMAPISASPDGRIVAVGEHEGHPRITLVDPGDGDVEVLADLEGVEPTVEERVAAAIVGDDLFFLAEGSLWRKAGVVG